MPTAGSRRGVSVIAPAQGVRGAKPLKLLFACRTKIISVCVIYNCERSERKIVLPIDFSRFLCHLRESSLEEEHGRISPWNPESSSIYKFSLFSLMLNKFSRRLRRGIFISGGKIPPRRCLDETLTTTQAIHQCLSSAAIIIRDRRLISDLFTHYRRVFTTAIILDDRSNSRIHSRKSH